MDNKQIAKRIRESWETVLAFVANQTRKKEGDKIRKGSLLVLDCTSEEDEQRSEGLFLNELVRMFDPSIKAHVEPVQDKDTFYKIFKKAKEPTMHISSHGKHYIRNQKINGKYCKGTNLFFPSGEWLSSDELRELLSSKIDRERPKMVIMSACEGGGEDMVRAMNQGGCRYFIAPSDETYWFDAATFIGLFYC